MDKEIEKTLKKASMARKKMQFADALAGLHQVVNTYPNDLTYKYLLAATYFEAGRDDRAEKYALEILEIEPKSKESLELLGLIATKNRKYEEAESFYLKALEIDPLFHNARFNLIKLYKDYLPNNIKIEENCRYMLQHRDIDRENASPKEKIQIGEGWYYSVIGVLIDTLARQHKFTEAISLTKENIKFYADTQKRYRISDSINDYGDIYQFYYLMKDEEALEKFKTEFKELFPDLEEYDRFFSSNEKWAEDRWILNKY